MPPSEVQWQPSLVVLASGLVLGALLVWWVRRRGGPTGPPVPEARPLELRDLDGRVAVLLRQLRELDEAAAKRTPEQLARERYALELEAARALQAREALEPVAPAPSPGATPSGAGAARGFLWGVASAAALAALLFFVWRSAERRPEGGGVTGTIPGGAPGGMRGSSASGDAPAAAPADDERTTELRAILAKNPEDVDTRLDLARHFLTRRDLMGVWTETQQILERKPGNPRALSYQALVRLAMGQGEVAVTMLQQAIAKAPDLLEARQNLAFVYASLGRAQEAEAAVAEVARRSPEEADRLRQALAQLAQARASGAAEPGAANPHEGVAMPGAAPETANPHEGDAIPGAAEPAPAVTATTTGSAPKGVRAGVFGWIEVDASVAARVRPGTVIFLTVREAGVAQGPPVAVKRLESGAFPLQFELGSADSMMGQPLPARMRIDARADSDGDPMTRPATDPAGHADGVELGRTGVRIALR
jgi:tetratricopeptide (TPR) repeat protein